jgi:protein-arginine kinase activator protein McsA
MDICPLTGKPCPKPRLLHIVDIENNKAVAEIDLCEDCAAQFVSSGLSIISVLGEQLKKKAVELVQQLFQPAPVPVIVQQPACPNCGWTLADIATVKKMGCPACYEFFDTKDLLFQIQGADTHTGKRPKPKAIPVTVSSESHPIPVKHTDSKPISSSMVNRHINKAQLRLDAAVKDENYARAAKIRDFLKLLKPIAKRLEELEQKIEEDFQNQIFTNTEGLIQEVKILQDAYDQAVSEYEFS